MALEDRSRQLRLVGPDLKVLGGFDEDLLGAPPVLEDHAELQQPVVLQRVRERRERGERPVAVGVRPEDWIVVLHADDGSSDLGQERPHQILKDVPDLRCVNVGPELSPERILLRVPNDIPGREARLRDAAFLTLETLGKLVGPAEADALREDQRLGPEIAHDGAYVNPRLAQRAYWQCIYVVLERPAMKTQQIHDRVQKDRPMTTISIRMPEDVVEDLKRAAPLLGFSGYQPLIRAYIGQGLRKDLERLDRNPGLERLVESLRRQGVDDEIINAAIAEMRTT